MSRPYATRMQVLDAIRTFVTLNRYPPTMREIAATVGVKSSGTVNYHMRMLRGLGAIDYQDDVKRSIVVLDDRCGHCGGTGLEP